MSTNLEEAATVAAEFVSSLENLPSEVQHLLAEIRHKDLRSQEIQQDINKEAAKYIRHSNRTATNNPGQELSAKDLAIPQAIKAHYAEIEQLSAEKMQLAERMAQLVNRTRARLDHDLHKVLLLQGEIDAPIQGGMYFSSTNTRNPVSQINESLRNAIAIPEVVAPPTPITGAPPPPKKRRVTAMASAGSIKLPSPAPVATSAHTGSSSNVGGGVTQRSRLSQQVHPRHSPARPRRVTTSVGPDADEDAEGEDDVEETGEENGDVEDKELYCFCQKLSYGEMIACDNPACRYQWFHLPCVNLKIPPEDRWYCSECTMSLGNPASAVNERQRKGRKK